MHSKKIKIVIIFILIILAIFNIAYVPGNLYVIIFFYVSWISAELSRKLEDKFDPWTVTIVSLCFAGLANILSFYIGNDELELRRKVEALEYRLSIAETKQVQQLNKILRESKQFQQAQEHKIIKQDPQLRSNPKKIKKDENSSTTSRKNRVDDSARKVEVIIFLIVMVGLLMFIAMIDYLFAFYRISYRIERMISMPKISTIIEFFLLLFFWLWISRS